MAQERLSEGALLFPGMATPSENPPPGGYLIHRAIDSGGFGITYEAVKREGGDPALDVTANLWLPAMRSVVVKEFFPDFASRRVRTVSVEGEDESHEETFFRALQRFQREAERLCYLTCLRALRAARPALGEADVAFAERIDAELAAGRNGDPGRAMQLVGRLDGAARAAAQKALASSTLPIVYDFFEADGNAYYVMEYLAGGTLKGRLNEDRRNSGTAKVEVAGSTFQLRRPWDPDRLRNFTAAALNALEEMHDGIPGQQLIHCDLKPGNIMFRALGSDEPVLIDFGLARNVADGKSRSLIAGTLGFAPLEIDPYTRAQYDDDRFGGANVGPWTDIYSMAAILRMLATGVEGSRLPAVFERLRTPAGEVDPVDKLPPFPPGFPEAMERGIKRGMALHLRDRPQSVKEWRDELGLASRSTPSLTSATGWGVRRAWLDNAEGAAPASEPVSAPRSSPSPTPSPSATAPTQALFQPPPAATPSHADPTDAETLVDPAIARASTPRQSFAQSASPAAAPTPAWQADRPAPASPAPPVPPVGRGKGQGQGQGARPVPGPPSGTASVDLGHVLNGSFGLIARNAGACLAWSFLLGGIPNALLTAVNRAGTTSGGEPDGAWLMGLGMAWLIYLIASAFLQATATRIALGDIKGVKERFSELLSAGLGILVPLVGLTILTALVYGFGLLLLIVPGVIMICLWIVAVPALVAEGASVTGALSRSQHLTSGSRWIILALVAIYGIGAMILGALTNLPELSDSGAGTLFILDLVIGTGVALVFSTMVATLYVELRKVKEAATPEGIASVFD